MRIAIIHELPPGGARRAVNEISLRLKKRHIVDLFLIDENSNRKEFKYFNRVNFFKFIPMSWKGKNWIVRIYKDSLELVWLFLLHRKISSKINSGKYDIAFVHGSKYTEAPFLLRLLQIPSFFYCHNPHNRKVYELIFSNNDLDIVRKKYEKINLFVRKIIDVKNIKRATYIISNSVYTQLNVYKTYGIASEVYYLGVDDSFFTIKEDKKDIDILFIGSYHPVDGYQYLEQALKNMKIKLKTKVVAIEDGWIDQEKEIRDLYQRSKIFVALAENEPFGLSVLEAMACGIPVIAFDEGGYKETVMHNKTGYLISKNPEELAEKITFLLSHPSLLSKMGKESRKIIEKNWSWDKRVKDLENMFLDVVKK